MFGLLISVSAVTQERAIINTSSSPYVKLRSIDIDDVKWTKGFWADKFELMHRVGVPNMWKLLSDPEIGHAYQNFQIAAGLLDGEHKGTYWHDGDFYKWLEATAYVYAVTKDPELEKLMDKAVNVIVKAQREDGYIHTAKQIGFGYRSGKRFDIDPRPLQVRMHHEDYNFGHLMTAACIHYYRSTGKTKLLNVAKKAGDFLYAAFKPHPEKLSDFGWNPSHIMGLVELYRTTTNPKYLELARLCIDRRGTEPGGSDWNQYRTPLRKETEAVGHAVTGNYLYAGAADLYTETGDKELLNVLNKIWQNITFQKMSVTGGNGVFDQTISSENDIVGEAYGHEYDLPNVNAYNETCANISNAMFNWRMLSITGKAQFADVMELILYNSALSGISLDGKHFFYTNPLRFLASHSHNTRNAGIRQSYINCFCCPPNIVRTIAKVHGWAYSVSDSGVWVNFYGGNLLSTELSDGSKIKLQQETEYPWEGKVKITIQGPTFFQALPEKKPLCGICNL